MEDLAMPDEFYEGMEKGIRPLVRTLHGLGVFTIESCEGHIEKEKKPYPSVIIGVSPEMDDAVAGLNRMIGQRNANKKNVCWILVPGSWEQYPPHGYSLELRPLSENSERGRGTLTRLQADAERLALFLQIAPD